ncbi:Gfo/Idh/MocA family oxidoreductase [Parahaliea maris]|uniref:Gfo/Idh/MocA family oxidoreductase n=1 Tax=Parahaliea maris TaxID=2716870 RepID=A0A5C8ZTT5_9GAMM|nr:Gfo/Idh/MocA family oxidoreductase [Parahaliea maris]TXS91866.1 Gfo/Idh/MocA family oxidoreductase [Parahaliea maris]
MDITNTNPGSNRRLRGGIVGGGRGAFIGAVHRIAVELDGQAQVVAGAMSSTAETARTSAEDWFLSRWYDDFETMAQQEAAREDGIDFVMIVTPNHLHAKAAKAFLRAGIHVMCEKPLAFTVEEAEELAAVARESRVLFGLTHTYTGYPAVREARQMVLDDELGEIRKVLVEYQQDWLMDAVEEDPEAKQAQWRVDPECAGISCCVGDIGSHAANLVEFVTGRNIASICADLTAFVPGRLLDDDANMLLRLQGGGKGTLTCSQVACGEENNLSLRVYGSKGGLEWHQQEPNTLIFKPAGQPWQYLRTSVSLKSVAAAEVTRTPGGHPEGYLEAFANLYRLFLADVRRFIDGTPPVGGYPSIDEGVHGMRFIARAVESSNANSSWVEV